MGFDGFASGALKTILDILTFVVVAGSAAVALVQLRHLRASNQLRALLALQNAFAEPQLQEALRDVQTDLPQRLDGRAYRDELARRGFVDLRRHPELRVCNFFDGLGAMLKCELVDEKGFLEMFARLAVWYWDRLVPVVALMRRNRTPTEYHNFEYLAIRAAAWARRHPVGEFPHGQARLSVEDPWAGADAPPPPGV
jgi:hypothetical protein